jgi:hypothetical protein
MKFEVSQLITIGTIIAVLAGFYYTTQHRLDILEEQVESLKKTINKINRNKNK